MAQEQVQSPSLEISSSRQFTAYDIVLQNQVRTSDKKASDRDGRTPVVQEMS